MNRLTAKIEQLRQAKRKALVAFVTAGFPDIQATEELAATLEKNGVDVLELGVPFSDPMADGPTIQYSSEMALRKGMSLEKVFSLVKRIRVKSDIPVVLMGYLNPFYHQGFERTMEKARGCGVDGLIIPDLIPEESSTLRTLAARNGVSMIFLAAPNTPAERLKYIDDCSSGFVYVVSLTGVTGGRNKLPENVKRYLRATGRHIRAHPRFVGFGISTPAQVKQLKGHADGIIVGSALIDLVRKNPDANRRNKAIAAFTRSLRQELDR